MVLWDSLLRAYVAENTQLLLVVSTHGFFYQLQLWKQNELSGTAPIFV
jgi:hypothetical protein